ncbi:hypothetical protein BJ508DRAFT_418531 [Ascobolus immersus RN42]|uniref:CBM-cenC domain-containing protein n=1 Tax=Ascobolus immersus RN42 TaxID=1160509 RepID=A0A3N4HL75_ASCIM|nr:hypothetical protein BJ508DRAFT_418531 [Ascobolus immersus RN42]
MKLTFQGIAIGIAFFASAIEAAPHRDHDDHCDWRKFPTKTVTKYKTVAKTTSTKTRISTSTKTKWYEVTKTVKQRPQTITTCPRGGWNDHHHDKTKTKTVERTKTVTVPGQGSASTFTQTATVKETLTIPGEGIVITVTPDATTITIPTTVTEEAVTVSVPTTVTEEATTVTVPTTITEEAITVSVPTTVTEEAITVSVPTTVTEEATTVTVPTTITEDAITVTVPTTVTSDPETVTADPITVTASTTVTSDPETITITQTASGPVYSTTQFMANPSFEDGTTGWTIQSGQGTTSIVTGVAASGSNALKFLQTTPFDVRLTLQQTVKIYPGNAYVLKAAGKVNVSTHCSMSARIGIPTAQFAQQGPGFNQYTTAVTNPIYIPASASENVVITLSVSCGQAQVPREIFLDDVTLEMVR